VAEFPRFEYSGTQVRRAGEALAGELVWTDEAAESIREIFKIANNWRDSHAYPMRKLRFELLGQMKSQKLKGITVARLKRMASIRRKLRNHTGKLHLIQDLAGCRAIVPAIGDVNALIGAMRQNSAHELFKEYDYINEPKPDGYRSHHMVFKFLGQGDDEVYNGRRIELQIRTRLQHSWATAVEAVGLFRREDMKAGQGDPDWLRLFQLMSHEFAFAEGWSGDQSRRIREIRELDKRLMAANTLENLSQAVRFTESYVSDPHSKSEYYLIRYNNADNTVSIEPHTGAIGGVRAYDRAAAPGNESGSNNINTVLVEVDKIENLKEAYPNYFGEVQLFKKN